ncbi:ABC transporter permease [Flindersiella endophytica]
MAHVLPDADTTRVADAPDAGGARRATTRRRTAKQWRLVWWRFRKHKLAMIGLVLTLGIYFVALFAEFLAPTTAAAFNAQYTYAPPQRLHFSTDAGLYVKGYRSTVDPDTFELTFKVDEKHRVPVGFFVKGKEYKLFGLIPGDRHLIGPRDARQPMYLLGANRNGYDLLSRIIYGTRISMTIGLVGVAIALALGILLGGLSGYFGGKLDTVIQRMVEFFMSIPGIPLWMGLSAALPRDWGPMQRYFAITVILAVVGWTDLARVVRGRFLALRQEEFVTSARIDGCSRPRVIFRHMLPSFTSHLIASVTLSIPGMILAETALSFLGLGLQAPAVSWGVLLQDAQNVRVLATAPWLMIPGVAVVVAVLALNFVGDGLRDAADPYKR